MKTTFIYTLEDPRDMVPRYVGKTNNPKNRLKSHIAESKNNKKRDHKNNWIRSLLKEDVQPHMSILEEVPMDEWPFWETYYGHLFLSWGFSMVFERDYLGIGTSDMDMIKDKPKKKRVVSEEGRRKMSEAAKKRAANPTEKMLAMYKKFGAREFGTPSCMKGKKTSEETKKKMSEGRKGEKAYWYGKKMPKEAVEKNA